MNATKFVVLMIFVGVVCAKVGARQLEEVSKENKIDISDPKTATTNGLGAELAVTASTSAYHSEYSGANAAAGPKGPSADGYGSTYGYTSGYVTADGPNANAYSSSGAYGQTGAYAAAGPGGATGSGYSDGYAGSSAGGSISDP
ncbi:hypothetical protein EUTSA_v10023864mg [Eutrema salsugineum]|uniref:Uncharacterized protein n=1 Tax=Eutrema salsugineum TaxID=72664 RepID=V4KH79_EUTSA|nr:UPF0540 protein At1g62000 [Eutrema salsugineum]ESQ29202.1 hypothetical protein EUTSA_v10023864mg [Eutrema salsugineum]